MYMRYHMYMSDQTMSTREVRDALGRRVDAAYYTREATVITKNGEPRAALVPHQYYSQLLEGNSAGVVKAVAEFLEDWKRVDSWDEATAAMLKLRAVWLGGS